MDIASENKENIFLTEGVNCYQKKDYVGAVEAFTKVINLKSRPEYLSALDGRAASYERLNKLDHAINDGRTMIKIMPRASMGYLRTGKILRLKGLTHLAMKIYERGLSKVPIGKDKGKITLKSMYNKLKLQITCQNSNDPLRVLPLEIVEIVFKLLNMCERVTCLLVSKDWKNLLESMRYLWTTIDTRYARRPIASRALQAYLRRSNFTVNRALVNLRSFAHERKMKYLMETCRGLRDLRIYGYGYIEKALTNSLAIAGGIQKLHLSESTRVTISTMILSFKACQKTLIEAKFLCVIGVEVVSKQSWPKMNALSSIHMAFCGLCDMELSGLIAAAPNISSVVINKCNLFENLRLDLTLWPKLERLELTETRLTCLPKLPPTLKHLILDDNLQICFRSNNNNGIYSLPLLETFSCESNNIEIVSALQIIDSSIRANNLKILRIGRSQYPPPQLASVSDVFLASSTLEELSITQAPINDDDVVKIVKIYPGLKKVNISYTEITGITVKELVNSGVKSINIDGCLKVSPDAVHMARSQGVFVAHGFR
ncbi:BgTH12-06659 [Blumeria graminis f. sp. triticale]|uniref:BgTH12-06659 n=1 Tax=Blumeria graminis f. sp. triticale TaxID=1689686 RepID=A0A9W4CYA0_BLUGR|nr:BgTH12-06659 [Blumeria graminis f. sp. triticale]